MNTINAVIYARVSTARQADDGLPIESQIEHAHRKAAVIGASVMREFVDAGISGRTDDRPAFQEAVAYCKAYSIDYFICWSTSRFARNKLDAALYKRELDKAGTKIVYVNCDLDRSTDSGWMMESILEIFDEHYSRQVSADTLRSMMKNARDGYWNGGVLPFGYAVQKVGKRKRLVINECEAVTVREIFNHCLRGLGSKSIAMALNEIGMLSRGGRRWSKNTITNTLKNDIYAGYVVFNRMNRATGRHRPRDEWIVTKAHDAIIKEDDFMTVLKIMGERSPKKGGGSPHSGFVFTGLLRCGLCGNSLQISSGTGRNKVYHYYQCWSALKGLGCKSRPIPATWLDDWLLGIITEKVLTRDSLVEIVTEIKDASRDWVRDRANRRDLMVRHLRDVEARLRNLYDILELHGKDAPNLGDLTLRMRELRDLRDKTEIDLIKLEEESEPIVDVSDTEITEMAELMRDIVLSTADRKKVREFLSMFIDELVISGQEVILKYNRERLMNRASLGAVHSNAVWLPDMGLQRTKILSFIMPSRQQQTRIAA